MNITLSSSKKLYPCIRYRIDKFWTGTGFKINWYKATAQTGIHRSFFEAQIRWLSGNFDLSFGRPLLKSWLVACLVSPRDNSKACLQSDLDVTRPSLLCVQSIFLHLSRSFRSHYDNRSQLYFSRFRDRTGLSLLKTISKRTNAASICYKHNDIFFHDLTFN